MQVTLFKALKSVNIDDTLATAVVDQLEEYVAVKIADATKNLEAQNKGLEAQIKGLETSIGGLKWQIGLFSAVVALAALIAGAGPVVAKFIH